MKDSALLCALDAYETKDSITKSQSLTSPHRQSSSPALGRARMNVTTAATTGVTDCDVEIIGEKVAKVPSKDGDVILDEKIAAAHCSTLGKTPKLSTPQIVVRLQSECGIGTQLITYTPPGMLSGQSSGSSNPAPVGTIGNLITSSGKVNVIFDGKKWVPLRTGSQGKLDDKADSPALCKPYDRAADCSDPSPKPGSADLQNKRQWKHADRSIFETGAPLKRPALESQRSPDRSLNGRATTRPALEAKHSPDRSPNGSLNRAAVQTTATHVATSTHSRTPLAAVTVTEAAGCSRSGSCSSGGVSATAFYGGSSCKLTSCSVRLPNLISPGRLSTPISMSSLRGTSMVASAATAPAVPASGSATLLGGGSSGSKLDQTGVAVAPSIAETQATLSSQRSSSCASPSTATDTAKPQAVTLPRRGRPRRLAAYATVIETVVLSSDEDSDRSVKESQSGGPNKKCRLTADVGLDQPQSSVVDDDLFPCIPAAHATPGGGVGRQREFSRRLVMPTSRGGAQSTRVPDSRGSLHDSNDSEGSQPADGSLVLHALDVRVGTCVCKSYEAVTLSVDAGMRLVLEAGSAADSRAVIRIDCRDMTGCTWHFSKQLAVMFLSTTPALGNKLRQAFSLVDPSASYFDPHGKDEAHRHIVIIFDCSQIASLPELQRRMQELFREVSQRYKSGRQMLYKHLPLMEASEKLLALGVSAPSNSAAASAATRATAARLPAPASCSQSATPMPSVPRSSRTAPANLPLSSASGSFKDGGGGGSESWAHTRARSVPSTHEPAAVAAARLHDVHRWSPSSASTTSTPLASLGPSTEVTCSTTAKHSCSTTAGRQCCDDEDGAAMVTASSAVDSDGDDFVDEADACGMPPCPIEDADDDDNSNSNCSSDSVDGQNSHHQHSESSSSSALPTSATMTRRSSCRRGAEHSLESCAKQLFLYPYPPAVGSIAVTSDDVDCLEEGEFLNDVIVDFYLKFLAEERLSAESRRRTHIFSSFFYMRLTQNPSSSHGRRSEEHLLSMKERRHNRVKTWTRHVDIFEKDFLIVPINENSHWFLAVICFPSSLPAMYNQAKQASSGQQCRDKSQPEAVREAKSVKSKRCNDDDSAASDRERGACSSRATAPVANHSAKEQCSADDKQPAKATSTVCGVSINADEDDFASDCRLPSTASREPACCSTGPSSVAVQLPPHKPCILIFDSLGGSARSSATRMLREYLEVEWCTRKAPVDPVVPLRELFSKENIAGQCPRCPQQDNYCDCGLYLLQYVESFFENPIKDYTVPIEPLFDWFPIDRVKCKRQELQALVRSIQSKYDKIKQEGVGGS